MKKLTKEQAAAVMLFSTYSQWVGTDGDRVRVAREAFEKAERTFAESIDRCVFQEKVLGIPPSMSGSYARRMKGKRK